LYKVVKMFVIKFQHGDDIRRITVEQCLPMKEIIELVRSLFRENLPQPFVLRYKDDEGDFVTITSDRELEEAFRLFKDSGILRLYVHKIDVPKVSPMVKTPISKTEEQKTSPLDNIVNAFVPYVEAIENELSEAWPKIEKQYNEIAPKIADQLKDFGETALDTLTQVFEPNKEEECRAKKEEEVIHPAVCDNCQHRIKGLRWKCLKCPDYDLCTDCKQQNVHSQPDHQFLKLERPLYKGRTQEPCQRPASAPPSTSAVEAEADIPLQVVAEQPIEPKQVPIPKKVEEKVKEETQERTKVSAFEAKLQQLEEMGFCDKPRNVQLLVKCNGDMVTVVRLLLQE